MPCKVFFEKYSVHNRFFGSQIIPFSLDLRSHTGTVSNRVIKKLIGILEKKVLDIVRKEKIVHLQ